MIDTLFQRTPRARAGGPPPRTRAIPALARRVDARRGLTRASSNGGLTSSEDGFTLFEVLIAAVILTIGLLGLFGLLDTSVKATASTRAREGATNLAREIIEDARTIPFAQLSPTSFVDQLQEIKGLENATPGSTWTIVRRESGTQQPIKYTVTTEECSIDDPKDGLAKEHDSTFCAGQQNWKSGETVDQTPIDFKRMTVNVTWSAQGRVPECASTRTCVHVVTMISSAGEAVGLSASELKLLSPPKVTSTTEPVITPEGAKELGTPEELTFSVSAPKGSTAVRWSLEGVAQSPTPTLKEGTTWTFKWKIQGISDGTYQVSAQAITTTGVLGPPVTISVTLIRGTPIAPKGIKAGFNEVYVSGVKKQVAELEWEANSERNVIGYRVYRPGEALACPESANTLSTAVSCIDFASPQAEATYSLAALYRNAKGEVSEGTKATVKLAWPAPAAPNPPTELEAKKNEDGSVTLTWKAPKEGAAVAFYRIYRGSTNYTSRYDTASAIEKPSYTDNNAITTHEYWVSAVSSSMRESTLTGPVSK